MGDIGIGDKVILVSPYTSESIYYVGNKFEVLLKNGMEGFPSNMQCQYMLISEDGTTLGVNDENVVKVNNDEEIIKYCSKIINIYSTYMNNFSRLLSETVNKEEDSK